LLENQEVNDARLALESRRQVVAKVGSAGR
jgi:hypothetical protein